jgi:hypothetical protein
LVLHQQAKNIPQNSDGVKYTITALSDVYYTPPNAKMQILAHFDLNLV